MSSLTISNYDHLGKTDEEKARILAKRYGLYAVVRYKNDPKSPKFTNFGTCEEAMDHYKYLDSPHCHEAEVIYQTINPTIISNQTPLIGAISNLSRDADLKKVVQLLIDSGALINAKSNSGWTPLHEAAKIGSDDIASLLISHGADIDAQNDEYKYSPLHIAAHYGHVNIIKLLISNGADISKKCNGGGKVIHIAADSNNVEVIDYLLQQGVDIDEKGEAGNSALHSAVGKNHQETVNFLIRKGADINCKNDFGITPLHYAAFFNQPDMVLVLLKHGADKSILNDESTTPLQIAKAKNNVEVVKYLSESSQKKWWMFWKQ